MIGKVFITKRAPSHGSSSNGTLTHDGDDDGASEPAALRRSSHGSNTGDSGRYIDPDNKDWSIVYEWRPPRINNKDIFTAIIKAIIIVAYDGTHEPFDYLNALSATGSCALNIHEIRREPTKPSGIVALTQLFMLADMVVDQGRFENLEFALEYDQSEPRTRPLEGFILGVGHPADQSHGDEIVTA